MGKGTMHKRTILDPVPNGKIYSNISKIREAEQSRAKYKQRKYTKKDPYYEPQKWASYEEYLQSPDWKQKRQISLAVRKKCFICSERKNLQVHHLRYHNLYDVRQDELRVVCYNCHMMLHDLQRKGILRFKKNTSVADKVGWTRKIVRHRLEISRLRGKDLKRYLNVLREVELNQEAEEMDRNYRSIFQ